jgi:hypothetical protein
MFIRPARILVVLMLVMTLGIHWALLQTFAWTAMLADNLRSSTLQAALTETFDGQHPCRLCKAVSAGRNSEQKKEFTLTAFKLEFPISNEISALVAPSECQLYPLENFSANCLPQQPPTPPPRGFFA